MVIIMHTIKQLSELQSTTILNTHKEFIEIYDFLFLLLED